MASARFRMGHAALVTGPWTWGSYDTALSCAASKFIKVELESTAGVDSIAVTLPTADPVQLAAGLPAVTVNQATKTATFQMPAVPCSINVSVTVNNGALNGVAQTTYTSTLQVNVLTATGLALLAVGETDQYSRAYGHTQKLNAAVNVARLGDSKTIYVDKGGNDTTAARGNIGLPFLTLTAALAAMQSGDVVRMGPGTWQETTLLPELAYISIIGAGIGVTIIEGVVSDQDGSFGCYPATTPLLGLLLADLTISNPGSYGIGYALDVSGANLATPGICLLSPVILQSVRCVTNNGEGSQIRCAGYVNIQGCELDGLVIRDVAKARITGTNIPDLGGNLAVSWGTTLLPDGWTESETRITGSSAVGLAITGEAKTIAAGSDLGAVTVSGVSVAGNLVTADACTLSSLAVTRSSGVGRIAVSVRGGSITGAVSAGDKCDVDIRGSHFLQASLAKVGDGTVERSRHREAIALINGDTVVTFAVPFTTNDYSVSYCRSGAGVDVYTDSNSPTELIAVANGIDNSASFILIHD